MSEHTDATGLVLWFQDGRYLANETGDQVFEPFTLWHVQKSHDADNQRRRAVCGYEMSEGRGRTDLFADVERHGDESDVCKICGAAYMKQEAADDVDA